MRHFRIFVLNLAPDILSVMSNELLNIAFTSIMHDLCGPGTRFVVWVQGCLNDCPDCIAPEWRKMVASRLISPVDLAAEASISGDFDGITISGGEPMLQAAGLAEFVRRIRGKKDVSVIVFTGYTIAELKIEPPGAGVGEFLDVIDVLIDGPYDELRNDDKGLRGSTNQRIHYLTGRISKGSFDFEGVDRQAEVRIEDGGSILVLGTPPKGLTRSLKGE